jgi:hypothetical protein
MPASETGMPRPFVVDLDPRKGVPENSYLVFYSERGAGGYIFKYQIEPSELNRGNVPKTFRRKRNDRSCFQLFKPN